MSEFRVTTDRLREIIARIKHIRANMDGTVTKEVSLYLEIGKLIDELPAGAWLEFEEDICEIEMTGSGGHQFRPWHTARSDREKGIILPKKVLTFLDTLEEYRLAEAESIDDVHQIFGERFFDLEGEMSCEELLLVAGDKQEAALEWGMAIPF